MTTYNCGFKNLKKDKTDEQIRHQLLEILRENDLIDTLFNEDLSPVDEADGFSTFDFNKLFLEISVEILDTIISLDISYDNGCVYRDYYLNGNIQSVEAEITVSFPEPNPDKWVKF